MKFLAAYLLAAQTEEKVTAAKITKILAAVGIDSDPERIAALLKSLDGKDLLQVIAEGQAKLASVPPHP